MAAGAHYNPFGTTHGGPNTDVRHVGDIGNVYANEDGVVYLSGLIMKNTSLTGPYSVLNRTLTIHENLDDLGYGNFTDSKTTGHSGRRIGCGIINPPRGGSTVSAAFGVFNIFSITFLSTCLSWFKF
jgi:superoxide dismutase, Cu-Zn family